MQAHPREIKPNFFFSSEKKTPSKQGGYYCPFGMTINERSWNASEYRFGFQGQEIDNDVKGDGNSVNYKYRMHDPRFGRFFAVDPLVKEYPHNSPYAFSENRVIDAIELEGLELFLIHGTWGNNASFKPVLRNKLKTFGSATNIEYNSHGILQQNHTGRNMKNMNEWFPKLENEVNGGGGETNFEIPNEKLILRSEGM